MFKNSIILFVILLSLGHSQSREILLTGYDCQHDDISVSSISLLNPMTCIEPSFNTKTIELNATIMLKATSYDIKVPICKIHITARIDGCGIGSHSYPVNNGILDYHVYLTMNQCQQLHLTNSVLIEDIMFSDLKPHKINTFFQNYKNINQGSCENDNEFKLNGQVYKDAYAQISSTLLYTTIQGEMNIETNTIKFYDDTICSLSESLCILKDSSTIGSFSIFKDSCNSIDHDILYSGLVNLTTVTESNLDELHINDVISIINENLTYSTIITSLNDECNFYMTDHKDISISISYTPSYQQHVSSQSGQKLHRIHDILTIKMYGQIESMRYLMNYNFKKLYQYVHQVQCLTKSQNYALSISLAYLDPNHFAYDYMKSSGYTAIVNHEVIHIIKCVPITVALRSSDQCYINVPIYYNNNEYFLTPRNHILTESSGIVPCTRTLEPGVKVNNIWYSTKDTIHEIKAIKMLDPNGADKFEYHPIYSKNKDIIPEFNEDMVFKKNLALQANQRSITSNTISYLNTDTAMDNHHNIPSYFHIGIWSSITEFFHFHITSWIPWWIYLILILIIGYVCYRYFKIIFKIIILVLRYTKLIKCTNNDEKRDTTQLTECTIQSTTTSNALKNTTSLPTIQNIPLRRLSRSNVSSKYMKTNNNVPLIL